MATQNKTDIGLIGLAVMGENLALNMESRGWSVSVYNRTVPGVEEGVVERFINGRAKGKHIEGFTDIEAFVESIALPRKIMMMVRAGSPVDELMEQLFPYLSPGDKPQSETGRVERLSVRRCRCVGWRRGSLEWSFYHAGRFGKSMGGGKAHLAEHCSQSSRWQSVLSVGGACRIGTLCEDDP